VRIPLAILAIFVTRSADRRLGWRRELRSRGRGTVVRHREERCICYIADGGEKICDARNPTRRKAGDYRNARQKRKSSNAQKCPSTVRLTRAALNKGLPTRTLIER
jgi:hypothetical protein